MRYAYSSGGTLAERDRADYQGESRSDPDRLRGEEQVFSILSQLTAASYNLFGEVQY